MRLWPPAAEPEAGRTGEATSLINSLRLGTAANLRGSARAELRRSHISRRNLILGKPERLQGAQQLAVSMHLGQLLVNRIQQVGIVLAQAQRLIVQRRFAVGSDNLLVGRYALQIRV